MANYISPIKTTRIPLRVMVAWQPVGAAMGVVDMCSRYVLQREQVRGRPLPPPLAPFHASLDTCNDDITRDHMDAHADPCVSSSACSLEFHWPLSS